MTQHHVKPVPRPSRRTRAPWAAAAFAAMMLWLPSMAMADEVRVNNLWIPNATIQGVTNGELHYLTNLGADVLVPLSQVQGLKVPAYPDLWAAQEATQAGKHQEAVALLLKVEAATRQPWLKNHATWLKVHAYDQAGQAVQAVEAYFALARARPDTYYLQRPPLASLEKASQPQKRDLENRLKQASSEFTGVAQQAVLAMLQKLGPTTAAEAQPPSEGQPAAAAPSTDSSQPPIASPGIVDSSKTITNTTGVVFSSFMPQPDQDEVTALLYQGKWQEAADKINALLQTAEPRLGMRLYQQGMAQLQLAIAANSQAGYKDAGLSFARSLIYFPSGAVAGACMVELAFIHQKIGRADLAVKLLDKARLQVDQTQEPALFERMETLVMELSSASTTPPPPPDLPE